MNAKLLAVTAPLAMAAVVGAQARVHRTDQFTWALSANLNMSRRIWYTSS